MRQYIVNLTNNLIGTHGFDLVFESMKAQKKTVEWKEEFVHLVLVTIGSREVRAMSPETLGKVICSMMELELPAYTPGHFFGKPEQYLRDIASSMLAWSIRYRLDEGSRKYHGMVPAYVVK